MKTGLNQTKEQSQVQVPLLNLQKQYASIKSEIDEAVARVIASQYFILGPEVEACEKAVAEYCHASYAVGVSSGTDALLIALMAENIGPGDEVITTPYSFFATAGCIARLGAKPVFVDIEPDTFNLNPSLIEKKISQKTKALLPVHLYGQAAEMDPILAIAKKHGLIVIEDAAQAIGAEYKGKRAGALGDYGCFSFFPSKNLGCFGDGGLVTVNSGDKAKKLKILRNHGMNPKYYNAFVGGNFRLDALQAAVVTVKIKYLDGWSENRSKNARTYDRLFSESGLVKSGLVRLPVVKQSRHIFNQYVIRAKKRDALVQHLKKNDTGCEIYYPVALHLQECFKFLGCRPGDFPESEKAANETLALPVYPELEISQLEHVVQIVKNFYGC